MNHTSKIATLALAAAALSTLAPSPAHAADRIGGRGGTEHTLECGSGRVATGIAVGTSTNSRYVGHFAVVCSRRRDLQSGGTSTTANKRVHWARFASSALIIRRILDELGISAVPSSDEPDLQILDNLLDRLSPVVGVDIQTVTMWSTWSSFIRPHGSNVRVTECPAGYALQGIGGRAGTSVDRIDSLTCVYLPHLEDPSTGYFDDAGRALSPVRAVQVGRGGRGGRAASSFCEQGDQFATGFVTRSGNHLYGLQARCRSVPVDSRPRQAKLRLTNDSGVTASCRLLTTRGNRTLATVAAPDGRTNTRRFVAPTNDPLDVAVRCTIGNRQVNAGAMRVSRSEWSRATMMVSCTEDSRCRASLRVLARG